jgi:hypothetical protein
MKRNFKTIAALAALAFAGTPQAAPATQVNQSQTIPSSNEKQATLPAYRKGQGIDINQSGGLDINYVKMFAHPNPIYFPKVRKWASQRREAQKRKKAK